MLPLEQPTASAAQQSFELQRVDFVSPEAGGRIGAVSAGNPLWAATWQLAKIGALRSDEWRAFMLRLRGSQRTFLARDIARPFPLAFIGGFAGMSRAGGGSFSGAAVAWSQSISADGDAVLTLSGLPGNMAFAVGDYVGFRWGDGDGRRALTRVVVRATSSASGVVALIVEPPVPTLVVPAGATAHLDRPACVMRLVPGQSDMGPIDRRLAVTSAKITAVQDLRP
ncbi:hypothetical protein [Sphingomonas sp. R86521]|uniref:hypothetical protein n=1 Tax=Sphingomonas sp. R86521 TaxID=3093860 RepID=UPI0036D2E396